MKNQIFNVKDKSVYAFMQSHVLNPVPESARSTDTSAYHWMLDEIIFKKSTDLTEGDIIEIELFDFMRNSGHRLRSIYTYEVESYDSVSVKLKLKNFKVELASKTDM